MAQAGQAASPLYSWMSPPSRSWRTIVPLGGGCRASAGGALHALEAAIAIRDRAAYAGLPVGIGIAVGPAIVGQLVAGSNPTAVGETTNLAAPSAGASGRDPAQPGGLSTDGRVADDTLATGAERDSDLERLRPARGGLPATGRSALADITLGGRASAAEELRSLNSLGLAPGPAAGDAKSLRQTR